MHFFRQPIPIFTAFVLAISAILIGPDTPSWAGGSAALIGVIGIPIALWKRAPNPTVIGFIAFFCAGISVAYSSQISRPAREFAAKTTPDDVLVELKIDRGASMTQSGWTHRAWLQAVDGHPYEGVRVTFLADEPHFSGERLEVFCELRPIASDDFVSIYPFSERNFQSRIGAVVRAREPARKMGQQSTVRAWVEQRRVALERRIQTALDPRGTGLALALLTGNKRLMDPQDKLNYGDTGTAHVLAISGLHFGVVAAIVWWVLGAMVNRFPRLLIRVGRRQLIGLGVSGFLFLYLLFVGAPVSAVRAWTIANVFIAAMVLQRQSCSAVALCLAASAATILDPWSVRDIGFHLSFLAAGGIILFMRNMPRMLEPPPFSVETGRQRVVRQAGVFLGVSTSATLATTPVLAMHFGTVSWAAFWTNLWVVPVVSSIAFPMVLLGTAMVSADISFGADVLRLGVGCFQGMSSILGKIALWDWSLWVVGCIAPVATAVMTLGVLSLIAAGRASARAAIGGGLLSLGLLLAVLRPQAQTTIDFIPVGQGDATLIRHNGRAYLIDGGGRAFGADPGYRVVIPFLRRVGVGQLDAVFVTHWDLDHYGGLRAVMRHTRVRTWVAGEWTDKLPRPSNLIQIQSAGRIGDLLVRRTPAGFSENDRSLLVLLPGIGLFTGDLEAGGERWLLSHGVPKAPLLKIPHHGSSSSSTPAFLDHVAPKVAIWSAGARNRFKHPHTKVIKNYKGRNIATFGTGRHGHVRVRSIGHKWEVGTGR